MPDTLSQLIRTALVAAPGCTLVDADFSAIEARVIAWLAGGAVGAGRVPGHGRIYEAGGPCLACPSSASARAIPSTSCASEGKVATLALGYQGGTGALEAMGALRMGIPKPTCRHRPALAAGQPGHRPALARAWTAPRWRPSSAGPAAMCAGS